MLFVVSVPNEYGVKLRKEARDTGKKMTDLIRDMLVNNFTSKGKSGDTDEILKIAELVTSSTATHPAYKWNRQEIYDH